MDYTARFDATACGKEIDFVLTVKAGVTTLCPCSKAISQIRGAQPARDGDGADPVAQGDLDRGFDRAGGKFGQFGAVFAVEAAGRKGGDGAGV